MHVGVTTLQLDTKIPWQLVAASYRWQPTLWSMGCFLSIFLSTSRS